MGRPPGRAPQGRYPGKGSTARSTTNDTSRSGKPGVGDDRLAGRNYVKSLQEQSIANWLWLNSVAFEYERQVECRMRKAPSAIFIRLPLSGNRYRARAFRARREWQLTVQGLCRPRRGQAPGLWVGRSIFSRRDRPRPRTARFRCHARELERRGIPLVAKQYSDVAKALQPVVVKHYTSSSALASSISGRAI